MAIGFLITVFWRLLQHRDGGETIHHPSNKNQDAMRHFSCLAVALLSCAAGVNGQVQQVVAQRFQFSDCTGQSTRSEIVETCVNQDPTPPREGYAARNQAYGSSYYSQYSQAYSNYYGYSQQRSKMCTSICGAPLTAKQNSTATNTTTLCENKEAVWSRQNRDGQFVDAESVQYSCRVSYGWGDGLNGALWALLFLFYSFCLIVYLVVLVCVLVCVAPRQGFSTPLHGCFRDLWTCFLGLCCPCVAWGKVAQAANPANHWLFMSAVFACCHNLACCLGALAPAGPLALARFPSPRSAAPRRALCCAAGCVSPGPFTLGARAQVSGTATSSAASSTSAATSSRTAASTPSPSPARCAKSCARPRPAPTRAWSHPWSRSACRPPARSP